MPPQSGRCRSSKALFLRTLKREELSTSLTLVFFVTALSLGLAVNGKLFPIFTKLLSRLSRTMICFRPLPPWALQDNCLLLSVEAARLSQDARKYPLELPLYENPR